MEFKVDECFSITGSLKLTVTEEPPLPRQTISLLCSQSTEEAALIRLLLGTASIFHYKSEARWWQSKNYSILGAPEAEISSANGLKKLLKSVDIDDKKLNTYLRHSLKQRTYYKEILLEIVHFFHRNNNDEGCVAFLHLYRFLERISYAFPLTYSITTEDYKGTYDSLKDFFGEGKGELGFFSKFIGAVIEKDLQDSTSTIKFNFSSEKENEVAIGIIRRCIKDADIKSDASGEIEVYNRSLMSLIVNLRNRFFHFNSGQAGNITLIELPDPDRFFQEVNSVCLGWLSVIYFSVLKKKVEIHQANT